MSYEATKNLIDKLRKIVDWLENVECENKEEEFYLDLIQMRLDEACEESIFILNMLEIKTGVE